MDSTQTYGIGVVALALITLLGKMWVDTTKRTDKVIEALEKVAVVTDKQNTVISQLSTNILANTEATKQGIITSKETADVAKQTAESVKQHADVMSEMVFKLLKRKK